MDKLSELSKPVAWIYYDEHDSSVMRIGWLRSDEPKNPEPLYSQEYVSALKHESAVNWEAAASLNVENQELKKRIAELEARLATPVRLPDDLEPNTEPCVICGVVSSHPEGWHYCHPKCGEGDA